MSEVVKVGQKMETAPTAEERKNIVVKYYDGFATGYGDEYRTSIAGRYFLREKIKLIVRWAGIDKSASVVELGCANGAFTIPLKKMGYAITGIDLSAGNVEESKKRARSEGLDIEFKQGDIENLHFIPDQSVDAVICLSTLRYLPDLDRGLGEMHRILRPGGVMFVDFANKWSPWFLIFQKFAHVYVLPKSKYLDVEHSRRQIRDLFGKKDFRDVKFRTGLFIARTTPDFLAYPFIVLDWIVGRIPVLNRMGGAIFVRATK